MPGTVPSFTMQDFLSNVRQHAPILAAIVAVSGWVLYRARGAELGVPHLGFLAALGTSIVGGVLGSILGGLLFRLLQRAGHFRGQRAIGDLQRLIATRAAMDSAVRADMPASSPPT